MTLSGHKVHEESAVPSAMISRPGAMPRFREVRRTTGMPSFMVMTPVKGIATSASNATGSMRGRFGHEHGDRGCQHEQHKSKIEVHRNCRRWTVSDQFGPATVLASTGKRPMAAAVK